MNGKAEFELRFSGIRCDEPVLIEMRSEAFSLLYLCGIGMSNFLPIEMRNALISISRKFSITNAAKGKKAKSHAPHLYLAKVLSSNASETRKEKATPLLFLLLRFRCQKRFD